MKSKRLWEIDALRGLAVLGMIIFHFSYITTFRKITTFDFDSGWLYWLGHFVRFTFIILVGVSLNLSAKSPKQKNYLHGLTILLAALSITLVSYIVIPEFYVRFGILHLIAVGVLLATPFKRLPNLSLLIASTIFAFNLTLDKLPSKNPLLYITGLETPNINSFDHFPLIPWLALIFLGIFLGDLYKNHRPELKNRAPRFLTYLGQNSLAIYLIHIPTLILISSLFAKTPLF